MIPAYNLPEFTAACPFRRAVYLDLLRKCVSDFTDADRLAWTFAIGRCVEAPKPVQRETWTLPEYPTYRDIERVW